MKIIISDIPGDFPQGYAEQFYIDTRSVRKGRDYLTIETAKSHKKLNDQTFRKRKIQSVSFAKYTIQFKTTESIDIELVNMANNISIENGIEIHQAEIIDFAEATNMQESEFRLYNLTYRDLVSRQTVDYLSSDTAEIQGSERAYYQYKNYDTTETVRIRTLLNVNFNFTPYEVSENNDNLIIIRSSESAFSVAELTAYVSEAQRNDILKYTNFTNLDFLSIFENANSLLEYKAMEVPEVIIEDSELEGLFFITIRLRYQQELKYPFAQ